MRTLPRLSLARVVIVLAAVVVGYFLFVAAGDILLSRSLSGDERDLRTEVANLHQQQADLEAIRDYLRTDEYIEGVARRVLGLVRPGESLVIVSSNAQPTPDAPAEGDAPPSDGTWWQELYGP